MRPHVASVIVDSIPFRPNFLTAHTKILRPKSIGMRPHITSVIVGSVPFKRSLLTAHTKILAPRFFGCSPALPVRGATFEHIVIPALCTPAHPCRRGREVTAGLATNGATGGTVLRQRGYRAQGGGCATG